VDVTRRLLLVVVVVVALAGAGVVWWWKSGDVAGSPSAARGATFWDGVENTAEIGKDQALRAFSYLYGNVPGVTRPIGPAPKGLTGSGPIRWVLNHWDELTRDQRTAVVKVLAPPPGEPPRLRQSDKDRAAAALRPEIDRISADLGARLGTPRPNIAMYLTDKQYTNESGNPIYAQSLVLAKGETVEFGAHGAEGFDLTGGPAATCNVYLPPAIWRDGLGAESRTTLTHEIFHCYQGFGYPNLAAFRAAPNWVIEGGAEFAGIDYDKKAAGTPSNWYYYLNQQAELFRRTYSAMGWWFHLQHVGHDPWQSFPKIWAGAQNDNVAAYVTAGGDKDDVYDTWAPSFLREPRYGDAWEVHGVDVPADLPPRGEIGGRGSASAPAFDARVVEVHVGQQRSVLLVSANQPIRVHDNENFEDVHITEGDYCLADNCVCPEGTERAGDEIQPVKGPVWLAIPGGETGTAVNTDLVSLDDYCRKKNKPGRMPPPAGPGPGGTSPHAPPNNQHGGSPRASSVGEPHLTSFDGHGFDFQAGGEFTLAESDKDDLEIQARQEPIRHPDGTEDLSVSINTAVAATVAGDRISLMAAAGRPQLRVNGQTAAPHERQLMPKGGSVAPEGGGYTVRWPDGTTLWVTPIGATALNVIVRPASARKGTLHGMLGPYEGVPDNPAMTDRRGRRYDQVSTDQLYKEVGESWRVPAGKGLFDYGPGQSTETFTRHDMPGPAPKPTDAQKAAAEQACAGIDDKTLEEHCEYDVAVTQDPAFAAGYQAVLALTDAGGGGLQLGKRVGPERMEPGQQKTYTVAGTETDLFFASDTECSDAATVFWRVTAPDGKDTLLTGMCEDIGRLHSETPGTWKIEVSVAANLDEGGKFAFRVLEAGQERTSDITLPADKSGELKGPGAQDRYRFDGISGDKVTLKSTMDCTDDEALYWGLESPSGFVISLRTRACEDLGEQTLTEDGTWSIVVFSQSDDDRSHRYAFTAA
jgi:von Willebrand factor type D domain